MSKRTTSTLEVSKLILLKGIDSFSRQFACISFQKESPLFDVGVKQNDEFEHYYIIRCALFS